MTQRARELSMSLVEDGIAPRFVIRDRDTKFVAGFDTVFTTDGTEVIRTPIAVPKANAQVAEPPRVSANGRRRGALLRELGRSGVAVDGHSHGGAGFLDFGRAAQHVRRGHGDHGA